MIEHQRIHHHEGITILTDYETIASGTTRGTGLAVVIAMMTITTIARVADHTTGEMAITDHPVLVTTTMIGATGMTVTYLMDHAGAI